MDLPADTKVALISFLKADYIPVLYFNNVHPMRDTDVDKHPKETLSFSRKMIHQISHLSGKTTLSEDTVPKKIKPMVIQVSRNQSGGRVKFDVSLSSIDNWLLSGVEC